MPVGLRRFMRTGAAGLTAVIALAAGAATANANAGILVASAPPCDSQALTQPFLPWLDPGNYAPVAGGDFEAGAPGWSLAGGAVVGAGNESFHVAGASDSHSLSLPAGASVTSPATCVGIQYPTLRFFAKRNSTGLLSALGTLRVDVLFELAGGDVVSLPIGVVASTGSWQPTLPLLMVANLLPLLPGQTTAVAFRFTAQGADFSVDDVYVDPYSRR